MSLILSGTDGLSDVDGTAATPAIRGTDANTGIFFGTDIIGFSEGGVEAARINADSQFVAAAGTAALPVITTTGDLNTGIFFPAADTIAFAEGGVEAARIDSAGNLGLGATPSAWLSSTVAMQIGNYGNLFAFKNSGNVYLNNNSFTNTSGTDIYLNTAPAGRYRISDNTHIWYNAASGTAGNPITFTQAMTLDASGNLLLGTTSAAVADSGADNIVAGSGSGNHGITIYSGNASNGNLNFADTDSTTVGFIQYAHANNAMKFNTNGSLAMTISSSGGLSVAGALSKGSGSFKIEHPLKPETHHLIHSFIEGPQADLIYRGKVNLVNGFATVNIDTAATMTEGTFVALCRDVQCFTSNESDWTAVRGSVVDNILSIQAQDSTSTASVSWMVIGERQDQHMYDTDWTDDDGKVIVEPLKEQSSRTLEGA